MGLFGKSLKRELLFLKLIIDQTAKNVITKLAENVNDRAVVGDPSLWESPPPKDYKPGHYAINWQLTDSKEVDEIPGLDPEKTKALNKMKQFISTMKVGGVVYMSNAVPYAEALENGHSGQAPQGVLKLAVMDTEAGLQSLIP